MSFVFGAWLIDRIVSNNLFVCVMNIIKITNG